MEQIIRVLKDYLIPVIISFLLVFIFTTFFFQAFKVEGQSMSPTLESGQRVIVNKIGVKVNGINKGEIIVFDTINRKKLIKRVIATEGDTIKIVKSKVYVNGQLQEEDYLNDKDTPYAKKDIPETEVPEGYLFVLGDNRGNSYDSREFGHIHISSVIGKTNLSVLPFKRME